MNRTTLLFLNVKNQNGYMYTKDSFDEFPNPILGVDDSLEFDNKLSLDKVKYVVEDVKVEGDLVTGIVKHLPGQPPSVVHEDQFVYRLCGEGTISEGVVTNYKPFACMRIKLEDDAFLGKVVDEISNS